VTQSHRQWLRLLTIDEITAYYRAYSRAYAQGKTKAQCEAEGMRAVGKEAGK
jgi:hypothetical protein